MSFLFAWKDLVLFIFLFHGFPFQNYHSLMRIVHGSLVSSLIQSISEKAIWRTGAQAATAILTKWKSYCINFCKHSTLYQLYTRGDSINLLYLLQHICNDMKPRWPKCWWKRAAWTSKQSDFHGPCSVPSLNVTLTNYVFWIFANFTPSAVVK